MNKIHYLLFFLLFIFTSSFAQVEITDRLANAVNRSNPDDYIRVIVYMRNQVDIKELDAKLYREFATPQKRAYEVITALKQMADDTQGDLISYFDSKVASGDIFNYQKYWVVNMFMIETKKSLIPELTNQMSIALLELDDLLDWDRPVEMSPASDVGIESVEAGLKIINADKMWALGYTGQGRVVMNIDTGVDGLHTALASKWRGNNGSPWYHAWFSPVRPTLIVPNECQTHGTHTMGIMCGSNTTDTVGVAPGAQWMAAQVTDCPGASYPTHNVASFQWAMNPDSNASTNADMPDVISCSWTDPGAGNQCTGIYLQLMQSVEASGIGVTFSAGNSGSGASTITTPKNLNVEEVVIMCVGNIQGALWLQGNQNPISSSSSRGPSTCGGTGSLLIKPEVCAPGTSIRSSVPGGFGNSSGTSMASPHVAGAVALLKQAFPNLTGKQLKTALYNTARDLGTVGEDNTYGKGLIDVFAAYQLLAVPVELTSFTATTLVNDVVLNWTTATETNNQGFEIEKRLIGSGFEWTQIGFVTGKGTTVEAQEYKYIDKDLIPGRFVYRIRQVDFDGQSEYSREVEVDLSAPSEYTLFQNYPNPFNPVTTIDFSLPEQSEVTVAVFNSLGEQVQLLVRDQLDAGFHSLRFDGSGLSSGTYVYQLKARSGDKIVTQSHKMSIVK